ncbi:MAG TPA: glycoside hydrolase family 2 TIM barrel-domain containing protein [Fibrobacteria bacterium]|nr:glycoside hydrolase family 2 TIM barrel-domain containing protein [Fibrobacteria bacterium]
MGRRHSTIAAAVLGLCPVVFPATGTLTGVVEDAKTAKPIASAVVRMLEKGLTDTSDSNGRFSFSFPTSLLPGSPAMAAHYSAEGGILFTNPAAGHVRVDVLDLSGREVANLQNGYMDPGIWSIPVRNPPDGLHLCRIATPTGTSSFRFVFTGSHGPTGAPSRVTSADGYSARNLAASSTNTIVTTISGYLADTVAWDETSPDSLVILLQDTGSSTPTTSARATIPLDTNWLFDDGDATGANQTAFADGSWRKLNVPHDWSIEGPYDQNATTTGYGGYLPEGIGWYRKHFPLPASASGQRIFVDFDGVMANSTVYINGTSLGTRPNGYVSFRYEITSQAKTGGADNVIAVKVDNSVQPASRWYSGGGINRHVRLLIENPVHIGKWSTVVTTPTTSSVHIQTWVVNQGTAAKSVSVQATLSDPSGTALSPVATAAQNVGAGDSTSFSLDMPVANAKLWSPSTPNMYQVVTAVRSGGTTLDDETTPFGIRTIVFNPETGLLVNGQNVKVKGVCLHDDIGGLGTAAPLRAWQRRLAVLKSIGVNAIRTSHNPKNPEVLDLMDRMGFLVLDEFFDVWTSHKYSMPGDYATYFKTWYQTDLADAVKRDRNHPSIIAYSIGNEIRDAIATRIPYTQDMVNICHANDATRPVTQALFQPSASGDYPGSTGANPSYPNGVLDILDVFGVNYHNTELLTAITANTPHHSGIATEMGMTPSLWTSFFVPNPQIVGEFIWTGAEYLGEANAAWPTVVGTDGTQIFGLIDRMDRIKSIGYQFSAVWGGTATTAPKTSTSAAAKVLLTVDHPSIATDLDDVAYVKASIVDASGVQVAAATNSVTFSVAGTAGSIVAVDNADTTGASYRGNVRKAFNGECYAIVQMSSPGSITITATAGGLIGSSVAVTGTNGPFVPCSGTCD